MPSVILRWVKMFASETLADGLTTLHSTLAALGAATVILSIALDPFFQQIVTYPSRPLHVPSGAIARSIRYDAGLQPMTQGKNTIIEFDDVMQASLETLTFGKSPAGLQSPVSCPTQNCTFEPFDTIGVCSACADIKELLVYTCLEENAKWYPVTASYYSNSPYDDAPVWPNVTSCGYFLNSTMPKDDLFGPRLMSGYNIFANGTRDETLLMRALPMVSFWTTESFWGGSLRFKKVHDPLFSFLLVGTPSGYAGVQRNDTPEAHECILRWCVKSITPLFRDGQFIETITSEHYNDTNVAYPWTLDVSSDLGVRREDVRIQTPNQGTSFSIENQTVLSTFAGWQDTVPFYLTKSKVDAPPIHRFSSAGGKSDPYTRQMEFNPWFDSHGSVPEFVADLATAMTNVVRLSKSSERVAGSLIVHESFVRTRWEWLSLPLILLMMTLYLLIATISQQQGEAGGGVGTWKTSGLATLLHGPDEPTRAAMQTRTSLADVRLRARELTVVLNPGKGIRLSMSRSLPASPSKSFEFDGIQKATQSW